MLRAFRSEQESKARALSPGACEKEFARVSSSLTQSEAHKTLSCKEKHAMRMLMGKL